MPAPPDLVRIVATFVGLLLLLFPILTNADTDTANSSPSMGMGRKHGKMGKGSKGAKKNDNILGAIRGHCTLVASPMNPLPGPCISVPLALRNANSSELVGTERTDGKGDFQFILGQDGPFSIVPTSGFYVLI